MAHIIGSQIPYHIHMIPHVKGLSICRIEVELNEQYSFAILDSKNALIAEKKMERSIKNVVSDHRPTEGDEWNIHGYIEVPSSLDRCAQDCDVNFIKVKHRYVMY
jgi:arrestin-related trafficking adapter 4/5/7